MRNPIQKPVRSASLLLMGAALALAATSPDYARPVADSTAGEPPLTASPDPARTARRAPGMQWRHDSSYYKRNWGVDVIGVHRVSSGYMLTLRYRVLDAERAKPLHNKALKPYLIDETTGNRLAVPTMENIGELRESPTPEVNRVYFIMFGNPGKLVRPGSRVSVVIGDFRLNDIVVD
jgi:hypothetical protein